MEAKATAEKRKREMTGSPIDSWSGLWIFDTKSSHIMEGVEVDASGLAKIYLSQHDLDCTVSDIWWARQSRPALVCDVRWKNTGY